MADPVEDFLRGAGWHDALRAPLAGDASARRYDRLRRGSEAAVLMIAPPGEEIERFARIDQWLLQNGFSAPQILAHDAAGAFMLLEDLGDDLFSRIIAADPSREGALYGEITDFLLALHKLPPPDFVAPLDGPALGALTELTAEWYPARSPAAAQEVPARITEAYEHFTPAEPVLSLRDFHAENVLWLPERDGVARLGLLDFQDAVAAHPAYDLVSALQDARRDVSPEIATRECLRYADARGFDREEFAGIYALLGAQRALRILGIFSRLCLAMGKPGYLALMPRMWGHLVRNLEHPALTDLRKAVEAAYTAPDAAMLQRMRDECGQRPMP